MQSPELPDLLDPRTQKEVIRVSQQDLDPKLFEHILRNAFDGRLGAYWHEDRSLDRAVRRFQASTPTAPFRCRNFKLQSHARP